MYMTRLLAKVRAELETPRAERPFGSGWLSGSIGILAGVTGLLMVIGLRNPSLTGLPVGHGPPHPVAVPVADGRGGPPQRLFKAGPLFRAVCRLCAGLPQPDA